jgi:CBS domain containing-hemolysin-like protein
MRRGSSWTVVRDAPPRRAADREDHVSGWLALVAVVVLIGLNGLFVAVEFAVVSARGPALDDLAESGDRRARAVTDLLGRLPFFLSMVQFGITVTSLLVGFLADRAVGATLVRPILASLGVAPEASVAVSVTLALVLSTLVQMLVGELFPKNVAISRPVAVARSLVGFSGLAIAVLGPIVRVLDRAAEEVTRRVFRVETPSRLDDAPGLDELSRIIAASGARGSLSASQTELLRRAVSLGGRRVGEVMVPRPDVVWIASGRTMEDLTELARVSGHSRFPIRGATEDDVLGTVHVKDQLQVASEQRQSTVVDDVAAPPLFVPESETLRSLLDGLRQRRRTFAVVVDEYGSTAGIVTLEDVLETLVGDIEDEFDRSRPGARSRGPRPVERVPGATTLARFAERFGVTLPEGHYETVAGLLMAELGRVPDVGDAYSHGGLEIAVSRREGLRVTEVIVRRVGVHS